MKLQSDGHCCSLVHQGHKQILLNFGDLSYMDSPGLGEIVAGYTTVSRAGGSLKLLNLTKRIPALLAITKLLTVFETFPGEQEAAHGFLGRRSSVESCWRSQ